MEFLRFFDSYCDFFLLVAWSFKNLLLNGLLRELEPFEYLIIHMAFYFS